MKFVANQDGTATVDLRLTATGYKGWQLLLISYLPKGNPKDTRSAKPVLRAKI